MPLLKFIFIIIIIYYAFRLLIRYVLPLFVKLYLKNVQKNFYKQNPNARKDDKRKDGDVKVDYVPKKDGKDNDIGEYVDFEEIDD